MAIVGAWIVRTRLWHWFGTPGFARGARGLFTPILTLLLVSACHHPTRYQLPETVIADPFISPADLSAFLGTVNAKLVFTANPGNRRNIFYVDFNEPVPAVRELSKPAGKENLHADSPMFSPDGKWIAYFLTIGSTFEAYFQKAGPEGTPILVSSQGSDPRWWVDPATNDTFLVWASTGAFIAGGQLPAFQGGATVRQKVDFSGNGSMTGAIDTLVTLPFRGGLSPDGNFLATAYEDAAMYDLSARQVAILNQGFQTCNSAISPDPAHGNWMLFLNFAGNQNIAGNPVASELLGDHEAIFVIDNANNYVWHTLTLPGMSQWQDPEWSNRPEFIVSLGSVGSSKTEWDGYVIRFDPEKPDDPKRTLKFTRTENFTFQSTATPHMWVGS